MARAYIGLGSNLADPPRQLGTALGALSAFVHSRLVCCSTVYRNRAMTDPEDPRADPQADYLNAVAALDTHLGAEDLLRALLAQEDSQGRRRGVRRWQARCIDLDLLLYADRVHASAFLTLPHPGLHQRAFVIHPLAEIAPGAWIPGIGSARRIARMIPDHTLTRVCRGAELLE